MASHLLNVGGSTPRVLRTVGVAIERMKLRSLQPRLWQHGGTLAFSIVEALVAACIVGVLFVALYGGITAGFGALNSSRENLRATQVLIDKAETLRLYSWNQISTFGTSTSYIPSTFTESFFPTTTNYSASTVSTNATGSGFTYYGEVSIVNSGFTENYSNAMKRVTITINWTNGVARSQTLTTFVGQYGIQNYIY